MGKDSGKADKFGQLRAKAEKKLNQKIVKLREQSGGDPEKALHELRVHQIELEMQNEELRRAQAELEASRNKYTDLYDFAPVGYFTFDKNGVVIEANLTGCRMLGVERANLIKKPFRPFVSRESKDAFYLHRQAALTPGLKQSCEIELVRKNGDKFYALLESIPAANEKEEFVFCRTAITDITERKKMELVLKDINNEVANEKNRLEAVMEALPTGMAIIDSKSGSVQTNAAYEQVWGGPPPTTRSIKDYAKYKAWEPDTGKPVKPQEWASAIALKKGSTVKNQLFEIQRFDGSRAFVLNSAAPVRDADGKIAGSAVAIWDITDLRKAEEELSKSEREKRLILDNANEAIAYHDKGHNLIWANKAYLDSTGLTLAQLKGKKCYHSWGLDKLCENCPVTSAIETGKTQSTELTPQNQPNWPAEQGSWLVRAAPVKDDAGKIIGAIEVAVDITERKQAEEALRESEEKYRNLVETPNSIIMTADKDLNITFMNEFGLKFFGYTAKELIGKNVIGTTVPEKDDAGRDLASMANDIMKHPNSYKTNVHKNMRKNGQLVWVSWTNKVKYDKDGHVVEILAVGNDITNLKKAEESLWESETRYRSLFENMLDGFAYCQMIYDKQGNPEDFVYLAVNNAFERLTGLKDVIGKKVTQVIPRIKELTPELFEIYGRVTLTGKPERFEIYFKPLGRYLSISVYNHKKGHFVAVFDDVTERKRAEDALRKINEETERFNRVATGRELRIIELKKEVNELREQFGQPRHYPLDFEKENENEKRENRTT